MLHTMRFHQTGKARKQMVTTIAALLDEKPRYEAAPTFAYAVGPFTVTRDGAVQWLSQEADDHTAALMVAALAQAGFTATESDFNPQPEPADATAEPEVPADEVTEAAETVEPDVIADDAEGVTADEDSDPESEPQPEPEAEAVEPTESEPTEEPEADEPTPADEDVEVNVTEPQSETEPEQVEAEPVALPDEPVGASAIETTVNVPQLTPDEDGVIPDAQLDRLAAMLGTDAPHEEQVLGGLTVEVPAGKVNTANLKAMLRAKGTLIRKALGINVLGFIERDGKVIFPWFNRELTPEEAHAYTTFITLLCHQSKELKRASSRPSKASGNEKYAMRCFLLRLGFIGAEFKDDRRILLRNLDGNSSWANGDPRKHGKEATDGVVDETMVAQQADEPQADPFEAQAAQKKTGDGLSDATGRELIVIDRPAMAA